MSRCNKNSYSKRDAEAMRNHRLKSRRRASDFLRIYPCRKCNAWHLTHTEFDPSR